MKQYYKGTICNVQSIESKSFLCIQSLDMGYFYDQNLDKSVFKNIKDEKNVRKSLLYGLVEKPIKEFFGKQLENGSIKFDLKYKTSPSIEIVYELVKYKKITFAKELYTGKMFPLVNTNFIFSFETKLFSDQSCNITLHLESNNNSIMNKTSVVVINSKYATPNEAEKYMNKFDKGFLKEKKKKKYIEKIDGLYKENVFSTEIKEETRRKQNIIKEKQNNITSIMENIEFLIEQITDLDEKKKFEEMYKEILEPSSLTVKPLSIETLVTLESDIEFYLNFNKKNTDKLDNYLENLKKQYLFNLMENNSEKTNLTLSELDKINELFLKTKNNYSIVDQRKILKTISLIYLLEVIENKDEIDIKELENSYFKDNIKSIILGIKILESLDLIECDINLYLNDDISVYNVVNIIKKIKVKKINSEEYKKLIMKI